MLKLSMRGETSNLPICSLTEHIAFSGKFPRLTRVEVNVTLKVIKLDFGQYSKRTANESYSHNILLAHNMMIGNSTTSVD